MREVRDAGLFVNKVAFTGHSLGGALATLAAIDFTSLQSVYPVEIVTFGKPRVGNFEFAYFVNSKIKENFRVINKSDPIPHTPFFDQGYRHEGIEVNFSEKLSYEYFNEL